MPPPDRCPHGEPWVKRLSGTYGVMVCGQFCPDEPERRAGEDRAAAVFRNPRVVAKLDAYFAARDQGT